MTSLLLTLFVLLALLSSVHILSMAAVAWMLGARPSVVRLQLGPRIFVFTKCGVRFEFGVLPGGCVLFREPAGPEAQEGPEGPDGLHLLHPLKQLAAVLSGCAALVALGLALGADAGALVRGFHQFADGALHPSTEGVRLLHRLAQTLRGPLGPAVGLLAMKVAAINLLPIPTLNGFQALQALLSLALRRRVTTPTWLSALGVLLLMASTCGWLIAVWKAV